jgi:hypothetical protein
MVVRKKYIFLVIAAIHIIINIFAKLFIVLFLHLRKLLIIHIFVKRAAGLSDKKIERIISVMFGIIRLCGCRGEDSLESTSFNVF